MTAVLRKPLDAAVLYFFLPVSFFETPSVVKYFLVAESLNFSTTS